MVSVSKRTISLEALERDCANETRNPREARDHSQKKGPQTDFQSGTWHTYALDPALQVQCDAPSGLQRWPGQSATSPFQNVKGQVSEEGGGGGGGARKTSPSRLISLAGKLAPGNLALCRSKMADGLFPESHPHQRPGILAGQPPQKP